MQLKVLPIALLAGAFFASLTSAQSLSPMHNEGETPSQVKGFKLFVGNPYRTKMTFRVLPMDPGFKALAVDAAVNYPELTLAPGITRQVIVTFRIDPRIKERTIGVCVQPKSIAGTVMPRVCGTYIGRLRG
jgi:hypothetical protein